MVLFRIGHHRASVGDKLGRGNRQRKLLNPRANVHAQLTRGMGNGAQNTAARIIPHNYEETTG